MESNRPKVRASELAATRPLSLTFKSFVRFVGDIPFTASDEFFELMGKIEQRGIVWISKLDEKKQAQGWALKSVIENATCFTMGPLEGSLEWHLLSLGAARIVAMEGNPDNYLKCLVLKAIFPELPVEFIEGDVHSAAFPDDVDIVFCPGVLYHLAAPHVVLQKICESRPRLVFLSTQLAVGPDHSASTFRQLTEAAQISHLGGIYHGRFFHEGPSKYLAGLDRSQPSIWLYPDDLSRLLTDIGFTFEDRFVVDLGTLGVCGSYVCAVPGTRPRLRYRLGLATRLGRRLLSGGVKRMSLERLMRKSALRG